MVIHYDWIPGRRLHVTFTFRCSIIWPEVHSEFPQKVISNEPTTPPLPILEYQWQYTLHSF